MEELYRENARIVYYFLFSRCHDRVLAEDLTQETFLRAIESIERFDGSCKMSTWLCQIAKHLLYQHWQKHSHEQLGLPPEQEERAQETSRNTEQCVMQRIELADVWEKVERLPEAMRRVMTLRVVSDLSYAQIGAMMGKSENWARVTYFRAKRIIMKEVNVDEMGL